MNENKLFDDIARTLANPIPRRQAFGHILRGIAGAALVSVFGSGTALAGENKPEREKERCCPPGETPCGKVCCPKGSTCRNSATGLCCRPGESSCGKVCCPEGSTCCNSAIGLCCGPGQICDGKKCKTKPSESRCKSTSI
jgi:hypothetical protein